MVVGVISCLALGLSSALIWVGTTQLYGTVFIGIRNHISDNQSVWFGIITK